MENYAKKEIVVLEIGIHNAEKKVWPNVRIVGCRFHFSQALYRKIQKLGLTKEYQNKDSEIGSWLHVCFGLIFLDHTEVKNFFAFE